MSLTVDKLLGDARLLASRLKDQDTTTDTIISRSQILHKRIEAMKHYQDDLHDLNEMSQHRPPRSTLAVGLAQENRQIRDLVQERQELQVALEEHQSALQLIMHKYRQHTVNLLRANRAGDSSAGEHQQKSKEEVCQLLDKVEKMAGVMQQAVRLDDEQANQTQEHMARLQAENQTLRHMLEICSTAHHPILPHSGSASTHPHPASSSPPSPSSFHHHHPFNASLDSSCSSQVSQIEVKVVGAEGQGNEGQSVGEGEEGGGGDSGGDES